MFYCEYLEAYNAAVTKARATDHPVGLEACAEYGRRGFSIKLIPRDPAKRFGWECRCEVVNPTDPKITPCPAPEEHDAFQHLLIRNLRGQS